MSSDITQWVQIGGAVGVLAFVVMAFLRGWIVSAAVYNEMKADRDVQREISRTATQAAEKAVKLLTDTRKRARRAAATPE